MERNCEDSYRSTLIEAGMLGHRFMINAARLGLSSVLVAGLSADMGDQKDLFQEGIGLIALLAGYV